MKERELCDNRVGIELCLKALEPKSQNVFYEGVFVAISRRSASVVRPTSPWPRPPPHPPLLWWWEG